MNEEGKGGRGRGRGETEGKGGGKKGRSRGEGRRRQKRKEGSRLASARERGSRAGWGERISVLHVLPGYPIVVSTSVLSLNPPPHTHTLKHS